MILDLLSNGLKKGAYLAVESWENDADMCFTRIKKFDTVNDAELELAVIMALKPVQNFYVDYYKEVVGSPEWEQSLDNLRPVLEGVKFTDNPRAQELLVALNEADEDETGDVLYDMLLQFHEVMGGSEYYYMRVLDSAVILEVPSDTQLGNVVQVANK